MPLALATPLADVGAVQVLVRNTFVECWTSPLEDESCQANIQSCPARCAGRCLLRAGDCGGQGGDEEDGSVGGELDGPKAASSRATTYSYTGSDRGDVELSSGCGDDDAEGWHALDSQLPPSFQSTPTNFMAALPELQFTSPFGNYLLPVNAAAFGNCAAVDIAECTSQGPLAAPTELAPMQSEVQSLQLGPQYLEGHCSADGFSAAERPPVVVLQLSSVLADACAPQPPVLAAAAHEATSTGPAPPPPLAPAFAPPSFAAPSLFEASAPPLPPPVHAPGLRPLLEGVVQEEPSLQSEPPVLSWADCSDLPSLGSVGHDAGRCKPCAFFHKEGCQSGASCRFCHLCEPGEKRKRQKEKKEQKEQKTAARKFRQAAPSASW